MSGLLARMHGLFVASSHAQIDRLEDPAIMSWQLLRETDEDLHRLRQTLVAAAGRSRHIERALGQLDQQIENHQHRAQGCLTRGDEAGARHQLSLKLRLQRERAEMQALGERHKEWLAGLREERATLLRERESLASQARMIGLRQRLGAATPGTSDDAYSRLMQRRERMARYAQAESTDMDALIGAQGLRREELGELPVDEAADLDAALNELRAQIQAEDAR